MKPITRFKRCAVAAAVLLSTLAVGAPAAAANLVVNGSFEQGSAGIGSFTGWQTALGDAATFVDSNGQTGPAYGQASDGLWSAFFGSSQSSGGATISQTLATTIGVRYLLGFDLANDNAGLPAANRLVVGVGGGSLVDLSNLGSQGYAHHQLTFTATRGATLLSVAGYNDSGYLDLDNLSVTAAPATVPAVPEPAAVWLLVPGLVGVGTLARRRRRRDAAA